MKKELMAVGGRFLRKIKKESPTLLIGVGIAASVSAVAFAIKNTPKANDILEEHKQAMAEIEEALESHELNLKEAKGEKWEQRLITTGRMLKTFAPTIIFEVLSITSIIFSHRISLRRQMALAAAYAASEAALGDKLTEIEQLQKLLPKKKNTDEAKAETAKVKASETLPASPSGIIQTGYGNQLCLDFFTGQWFYADHEKVRQICGKLDDQLRDENELSVDTIQSAFNLPMRPIHKEIAITTHKVSHFDPEFRYLKIEDIPGTDSDIWAKNIPPLTPVLVIDYEDEIIESLYGRTHGKYNYYGDH